MLSILKFIRFKMLMILLCLLSCKAMKENGSSASKDTIDNQKIDYKQYDKCIVEVVTFTDGDSAVDRWCDSKGFGTHKFKRGFEGERDYLVKNSIKDLKAVGFIEDHKTTRSFNSFGWWRNQSGFQKHPHHVTQSTFSQVLKDVNVCLVYRDHLPNREFFIHCGEDEKQEFYFTEEFKAPPSFKDIVDLFKAAGFNDSLAPKEKYGNGAFRFDRVK